MFFDNEDLFDASMVRYVIDEIELDAIHKPTISIILSYPGCCGVKDLI